jgi:prepilin-type N-terminal cleavage/methylation domain-containing protein
MKNNQKGFSVVEVLIVIVIVGLIGAVGWLVMDRQNNKAAQTSDSQTAQQEDNQEQAVDENQDEKSVVPEGWTKYEFKAGSVSFAYPNEWSLIENLCDGPDTEVHLYSTKTNGPKCGTDGGAEMLVVANSTVKPCDPARNEEAYSRECTVHTYGSNQVTKEKTTVVSSAGFYEKGEVFYRYFLKDNKVQVSYMDSDKVAELESLLATVSDL